MARFRRIFQSQLAEDGFNREKGEARHKQNNRTGREVLAYNALVTSDLLGQVHGFDPVAPDGGQVHVRSPQLPKSATRPTGNNLSMDLPDLVSYSSSTSWYSTSASRLCTPHADLVHIGLGGVLWEYLGGGEAE